MKMRAILVHHGLHKALEGKPKELPEGLTNEKWEEMDLKALCAIHLCLSNEVLREVAKKKSAARLWLKLESLYMTKFVTNHLLLKSRLHDLRLAKGAIVKAISGFDSLMSYMMRAHSKSLSNEDTDLKEDIIAFMKQGRMMQIVLRNAGNLCIGKNEGRRVFFEDLVTLIPKVTNCATLWYVMSTEKHLAILDLQKFNWLIKQEMEEVFYVPNFQSMSSHKSHQLLRFFLHFLVEILNDQYTEDLLQLLKSDMNEFCMDIATLANDLSFLMTCLSDTHFQYPQCHNEMGVVDEIKVVANRAGQLCYFLFIGKINIHLSLVLSDLLMTIEVIKEKVKAHVKEMRSAISRTWTNNELAVIFGTSLLEHLNELLKESPDMILSVKTNIEILIKELAFPICFLMNTKQQEAKNEDLKNLMTHIAGVVDKADYLIGSVLVQGGPVWYFNMRLSQVVAEIHTIKTKMTQIEENQKCGVGILGASVEISTGNSSQAVSSVTTEVLLDFDQEQEIKDQLIDEARGLKLISIVGMPGLGKTTLARKIYGDPTIFHKFHVRLFCTVSPTYQKRLLLLDIIRSVGEPTDYLEKQKNVPLDARSDEDLAKILYQCLKGKRYLLIMDDVWDTKPWDDFLVCLPDDTTASRVIFTSRSEDLSLQGKPHKIFKLSFFSEDRSWYLLRQNLFHNGECPLELEEIGKEIAKKCQGLPLLINLVGGLLKETNGKLESWDIVSRSFSSHMAGDSNVNDKILEQSERILEHSYENLPYMLKPCLLYCGCFPKERAISTRKLKLLWVAEGFILKTREETIDNAAENCLTDLINRSLLLVVDRRFDGSVKTCRIHALLHDFCLRKAEEMHFLKMIDRYLAIYEQDRRLVITSQDCPDLFTSMPLGPHVSSLLANPNFNFSTICDVSFLFYGFKLLRVLDLEELMAPKFPREIGRLVLLKYLAIRCRDPTIPLSVRSLRNLETFFVNANTVPDANIFCGLSKLRHLHFQKNSYAVSAYKYEHNAFEFSSVQTLSCVCVAQPHAVGLLRSFPNLRKLRCSLAPFTSDTIRFPAIDFLDKLETLNLSRSRGFDIYNPAISALSLPSYLRQLTLSALGLPWKELSAVARSLPNLQFLKLLGNAFKGDEWDMGSDEIEFPELKFLKMENLDIKHWKIVCPDEFPKLQQLKLCNCRNLEEIPDDFAYMQSLLSIEVLMCKSSTHQSAVKIKEIQQECCERFQVLTVPEATSTYYPRPYYYYPISRLNSGVENENIICNWLQSFVEGIEF